MTEKTWHERERERILLSQIRLTQWDILLAAIKARGADGIYAPAQRPQYATHPGKLLRRF